MAVWIVDVKTKKKIPISASVILGRLDGDINFKSDTKMSRRHLKISQEKNQIWIEDLRSQNGTTINGERLRPNAAQEVGTGTLIQFGNQKFKVVSNVEPEPQYHRAHHAPPTQIPYHMPIKFKLKSFWDPEAPPSRWKISFMVLCTLVGLIAFTAYDLLYPAMKPVQTVFAFLLVSAFFYPFFSVLISHHVEIFRKFTAFSIATTLCFFGHSGLARWQSPNGSIDDLLRHTHGATFSPGIASWGFSKLSPSTLVVIKTAEAALLGTQLKERITSGDPQICEKFTGLGCVKKVYQALDARSELHPTLSIFILTVALTESIKAKKEAESDKRQITEDLTDFMLTVSESIPRFRYLTSAPEPGITPERALEASLALKTEEFTKRKFSQQVLKKTEESITKLSVATDRLPASTPETLDKLRYRFNRIAGALHYPDPNLEAEDKAFQKEVDERLEASEAPKK